MTKQKKVLIFTFLHFSSIVTFVFSSSILRRSCSTAAYFVQVSTSLRMNRPPLAVLAVSEYSACAGQCLFHQECRSFCLLWQKKSALCTLYREDRTFHTRDLVEADGYEYYDTLVAQDNNDELAASLCRKSEHRCLNEGCNDWCSKEQTCLPFNGKSCKDIQKKFNHFNLKSGFYTVELLHQHYAVYCDMETVGGGWMLIGKVDVNKTSDVEGIEKTTVGDIFQLNAGNFVPSPSTFRQLKDMFNATQLRMYCHKDSTNKTVHIYTSNNETGRAVLEYISKNNDVPPTACGSFLTLSDDNSYLSRHCWEWGYSPQNRWWFPSFSNHAMAIRDKTHFSLMKGRSECDDYAYFNPSKFQGIWRIYQK